MKKLVLYGAGVIGKRWLEHLGTDKVYCFADSNKELVGSYQAGKLVKSIDELQKMKEEIEIYISVSYKKRQEIVEILRKCGLEENILNNPYGLDVLFSSESSRFDVETKFEGKNRLGNNSHIFKSILGYASYIADNTRLKNVHIGRYSCIGPNVQVILGQHPAARFVSIHPAFYSPDNIVSRVHYVEKTLFEEYRYTEDGYAVKIGNDVWIGQNVSLMEGITIGDGAIIAAGAVVTKDVLPYSIVGGVPAKEIRKRFSEEEIDYLQKLQWWNRDECWIKANAPLFSDIKILMKAIVVD